MVDLVAIVPFYIELLVDRVLGDGAGGGFDLRFLRLARVFRIFKLSRYGHRMQLVFDALIESREILAMLSVNLVILVVVFSSITYYAEKDEENTKFQSIPATCWWCIVTVLTVGYGASLLPRSLARRCAVPPRRACFPPPVPRCAHRASPHVPRASPARAAREAGEATTISEFFCATDRMAWFQSDALEDELVPINAVVAVGSLDKYMLA